MKQALSALGGLFYVADNQFEQFYSARHKSKIEAEKTIAPEDNQELNLDTVIPYLKQKLRNRNQPSSSDASKLVRELKSYGYKTVRDLDQIMDRGEDAFQEYERKFPPSSGRFVAQGVVRITDRIVNNRPNAIAWQFKEVAHLIKPE